VQTGTPYFRKRQNPRKVPTKLLWLDQLKQSLHAFWGLLFKEHSTYETNTRLNGLKQKPERAMIAYLDDALGKIDNQ
jgi:hypothetical protein